jgi:hypothetical protein
MTTDETRKTLLDDINNLRSQGKYYESLHSYDAKNYPEEPTSNFERALTTMPSKNDIAIS